MKPLLKMRGITKEFSGVYALNGVDLTVKAGTVHALMGENGAGKSTLMKCLFGIYRKTSGRIYLDGEEVDFRGPRDALEHGVAMVHQELSQAMKRSVSDNLFLGRYPTRGIVISEKRMIADTKKIFEELGITTDPRTIMEKLSVAERQMVEIAKAVSYRARILVLDEPTSSLTDRETEKLFAVIGKLKSRGCGIIYISHKMEEILRIADEITVMRDGAHIVTAPATEFTMDRLIREMVGRELSGRFPPKTNVPGETLLEVRDLRAANVFLRHADLSARAGEIVGIAGLAGSGRSELLGCIYGLNAKAGGEVRIGGKEARIRSPRDAIRWGMALLTEERRATGIFSVLDLSENTTLSSLGRYLRCGFVLQNGKRYADTDEAIRRFRVKATSRKAKIGTLSGGNQQKVILARWLLTEPQILLLDEPTRGIDVGSKYEIYELIFDLAAQGKCIVMVSGELPELLGVADRIYVMSGGETVGCLDGKTATQEEIMRLSAMRA